MTIFDTFKECFTEEITKLENGKKTEQWALEAINSLGEDDEHMEHWNDIPKQIERDGQLPVAKAIRLDS